jgi:formylglycine-generating enzyme required for sulfatase activity
MGNNASDFKGPDTPVETASWEDCQTFLRELNEKVGAGRKFALPTEAQWEYACRAGGTGKFCYGDDEAGLGEYAWYASNSASTTHPGGQKKPNAWGLYDMHGNVWEWCADWYGDYGAGAETDPAGASSGIARVLRGGSWLNSPTCCRAAYRNIISFGYSSGVRVVCDVSAGPGLSE